MEKLSKFLCLALTACILLSGCDKQNGNETQPELQTLSVSPSELTLEINGSACLQIEVFPEEAETGDVKWSSSDEDIIIVDNTGTVTAISAGAATVTASAKGKEGHCQITVTGKPVESITLNETELELTVGEKAVLTASITPEDAEYGDITWSSSDESVTSVDAQGTVTAVSAGKAKITASAGDKEAYCNVTVTGQTSGPKTGDILYSDGSWSTSLDAGKTPIGVIFWTGDATADDPELKKDFPECNRGLAVALSQKITPWQYNWDIYGSMVNDWVEANTSYIPVYTKPSEEYFNKCIGYNNTKALSEFNAETGNSEWPVEAVQVVSEYNSSTAAPEGTSGWYLPSPKELSLLCSGEIDGSIWDIVEDTDMKVKINEVLSGIDGAEKLFDSGYWSSTEYSASNPYYVFFYDGAIFNDLRKSYETNVAVRCILAF